MNMFLRMIIKQNRAYGGNANVLTFVQIWTIPPKKFKKNPVFSWKIVAVFGIVLASCTKRNESFSQVSYNLVENFNPFKIQIYLGLRKTFLLFQKQYWKIHILTLRITCLFQSLQSTVNVCVLLHPALNCHTEYWLSYQEITTHLWDMYEKAVSCTRSSTVSLATVQKN